MDSLLSGMVDETRAQCRPDGGGSRRSRRCGRRRLLGATAPGTWWCCTGIRRACQDRWLDLGPSSEAQITGDRRLLARVLGNPDQETALEASPPWVATVDVAMTAEEGQVEFTVHKREPVMPLEVQLQLFQRRFRTKGGNRGLGTYSVKSADGAATWAVRVWFVSNPDDGTVFHVRIPVSLVAAAAVD